MNHRNLFKCDFRKFLFFKWSAILLTFLVFTPSLMPLMVYSQEEGKEIMQSNDNDSNTSSETSINAKLVETNNQDPTPEPPKNPEETQEVSDELPPEEQSLTVQGVDPEAGFKIPSETKANIDQSTGALLYSYPIEITKGRAGMTPELSLKYNSRNATRPDSITGIGWEISIPYIKREPQKGTNNLYSKAFFESSLSGNLIATTDTSSSQFTTYLSESDDGDYLKYIYNSDNSWTLKGKDGMTYVFGASSSSRQDNSADTAQVYKWMLASITDTNGNSIQYTYIKDQGQIYPEQINYTQHTSSAAANNITFSYSTPSSYGATTYDSAFSVTTAKLLSSITATTSIGIDVSTHTHTLNYADASFLKQKQLISIQESGSFPNQTDNAVIDPTIFTYSTKTPGWENSTWSLNGSFDNSTYSGNNIMYSGIRAADFDNNGYEDVLISYTDSNFSYRYNYLMMNNGSTFTDALSTWGLSTTTDYTQYLIADVNGDNLPDLIPRYSGGDIFLNTGTSFTTSSTYDVSDHITEMVSDTYSVNVGDKDSREQQVFLYDINVDGKNDIIFFHGTSSNFRVYLNTGTGWTSSGNYTFSAGASGFPSLYTLDNTVGFLDNQQMLIDINGDGLADYVNQQYGTFLNTGSGFTYSAAYSLIRTSSEVGRGGIADINGDGLVDFVYANTYYDSNNNNLHCNKTYLNNGKGFTLVNPTSDTNCPSGTNWYGGPLHLDFSDSSSTGTGNLLDINSDGYPDALNDYASGGAFVNGMNDGKSVWNTAAGSWGPLIKTSKAVFLDVNADTIIDFITPNVTWSSNGGNSTTHTYIGKSSVPNLLTTITSPLGSTTTVTYGTVPTVHVGTDIAPISVVKKIAIDPKYNQSVIVTSYDYLGGAYVTDSATKQQRFAGFQKVTATESGTDLTPVRITDTYFHQANGSDVSTNEAIDSNLALIGKPYYSVIHNSANTTKKQSWFKYGTHVLTTEPIVGRLSTFVYPTSEVIKITDSGASYATAKIYTFDTTIGEKTSTQDLGFVTAASDGTYTDISGDSRFSYQSYATNSSGIVKLATSDIRTSTSSSDIVSKIENYYDSQSLGVINTLGNLTKESKWVSGNGSVKADTTYAYDIFGNILTITNPLSSVITYTYDTSNSYIATNTNHLNHVTSYTYKAGKISSITNPNFQVITLGYNNIGWLTKKITQKSSGTLEELQTLGGQTVSGTYYRLIDNYSSTGNSYQQTYQMIDGLGRAVRTIKVEQSDSQQLQYPFHYITSATSYDALGRSIVQSVPSSTGATYYLDLITSVIPSAFNTTTTYDIFDRPLTTVNNIGTITYSYSGPETITIDGNSHQKKIKNDAYGNLTEVKEYGSGTYTTAYEYDVRNLLTKITDALGNVRNFTYNNAGWVTNSQDLHASADGTYGATSFTYDNDGNVLTETKPNGIVVIRTYDALDRMATVSDSAGTTGSYTLMYDSCTKGKGLLCSVSATLPNSVTLNKTYTYDISGNPLTVAITTLGNTYTTTYEYSNRDQVKKVTYPNDTIVRTDFGFWALPANTYVTLPSQSEVTYATYAYHGPTQKIAQITRLNGPTTNYTYDNAKLWRLSRKLSSSSGSSTTTTFNAAIGDGNILSDNASWDTAHDATTGTSVAATNNSLSVGVGKAGSSYSIARATYPFDTSSLPDNANVTAATLRFYVNSKQNLDNDGDDWITIVKGTQASGTTLTTADFDEFGAIDNPVEGINTSERRDITGIANSNWQTFTLNSTGMTWINPTGYTKLGLREGHDVIDSPVVLAASKWNSLDLRTIERGSSTPTLEVTYNTNSIFQDLNYSYDNVGNITQVTDIDSTKTYTYDNLDRLTQAVHAPLPSGSPVTYTYAYDAIGNITTANGNVYTYSGTGKTNPHAVTSIGANNYAYDDNGNVTTAPNQMLTYNWQNQPTAIIVGGTTTINSSYDEAGNRFIYKTPTNTEIQVTPDYLLRNTTPEISLKLGDVPVGTIVNNVLYGSLSDHLNTSVKQMNSSGTPAESVSYDPFGKIVSQSGTLNTKDGFTGHEEDTDTGLVYAQARYYNPSSLRFSQQDPSALYIGRHDFNNLIGIDQMQLLLDPQQLNSYSYVRNNPIALVDKTGKYFETAFDIAMLSLSLNDFRQEKSFWNGFSVVADGASLLLPIPAFVGTIRHADDAGKFIKNSERIISSGDNIVKFGFEYARNIGFKMDSRAWTQGNLYDGLGNLVDHYVKHGDEVGARSVSEYYSKANNFIGSKGTHSFADPFNKNGDMIHFNPYNNQKVITDSAGSIRSFYTENRANYQRTYKSIIKK